MGYALAGLAASAVIVPATVKIDAWQRAARRGFRDKAKPLITAFLAGMVTMAVIVAVAAVGIAAAT